MGNSFRQTYLVYDEHAGVGRMLINHVFEKDHALLGCRPVVREHILL
jgi:hypothetical protein